MAKCQEEPRLLIFYLHLEVETVPFPLHIPYHSGKSVTHVAQKLLLPKDWMHLGSDNNTSNPIYLYEVLSHHA